MKTVHCGAGQAEALGTSGRRKRDAEVGDGGNEDEAIEDGNDGFIRGGRKISVGGRGIDEDSGDAMKAAEATLDEEDLIGNEFHGSSIESCAGWAGYWTSDRRMGGFSVLLDMYRVERYEE